MEFDDGSMNTMAEQWLSKALSMHNVGAVLPPLFFRNPHFFEARQAGQDAGPAEHTVATILRCTDLDLHGGGGKPLDVLFESLLEAGVHGRASADNDVVVKVLQRGSGLDGIGAH
jgi:hypothetical protein